MANVTVTIRAVSDDAVPVIVDGVLVRVYDENDIYQTEGTTAAGTGEVDFTLNGDDPGVDYILRLSKDGFSFPPDATKSINVTDPPDPNNTFEFTSHEGETAKVAILVVKDDQAVPEVVEDFHIWVYDSSDAFLTEGDTDSSGELDIPLEGDPDPGREYIIRLRKSEWTIPAGLTQVIRVLDPVMSPATNTFDFEAHHALEIPESSDPDLCTLSGYITDASLRAMPNTMVRFVPRLSIPAFPVGSYHPGQPAVVRRNMVLYAATVYSNDEGYVEVSLPRNGLYDIHIGGAEHPTEVVSPIIVPDAAGVEIEDVIFPYVVSVVYGSDPITVGVGEVVSVSLTILLSNGVEVTDCADIGNLLEFSSNDVGVSAILVGDGTLTVSGVASGTTTISVERTQLSHAVRLPDIADLVVTDPTVEVS